MLGALIQMPFPKWVYRDSMRFQYRLKRAQSIHPLGREKASGPSNGGGQQASLSRLLSTRRHNRVRSSTRNGNRLKVQEQCEVTAPSP